VLRLSLTARSRFGVVICCPYVIEKSDAGRCRLDT
jgi:hypothetical protein